jgi:hypothetical protein
MVRSPNRLLIALLVFLIGIGPIGSVMASAHSCGSDAGQSTVGEGLAHGDHGRHQAMTDTLFASLAAQGCDGCDTGCCQGGLCSVGHCAGTAAVLQTSTALEFARFAASATTMTGDRPLAGRLTPPFRPPQA